jgi:threonine aldolase
MIADFRSDTLTKPTSGMLERMMAAEVGDDVWEEDPTVRELENRLAAEFGMGAGIFCPSGTMANQIAIRLLTSPQDEVICASLSHIYHYEAGGTASNSLVSLKLIPSEKGILSPDEIRENINPRDVHFPTSRLLVLENTCNKGGGYSYSQEELESITSMCRENKLLVYMDGARVYNAIISRGYDSMQVAQGLDSISVCLSKGLGCPVGTVLLIKDPELLFNAKRVRKAFGGGMRQAGYLAAAGLYAIENNITRLSDDHENAKKLGKLLSNSDFCEEVKEVETNIVLFKTKEGIDKLTIIKNLEEQGVLCAPMGKDWIRFVTHLGIDREAMSHTEEVISNFNYS